MRIGLMSFLVIAWLACTGCTRYEYDITHPPDLATHIAKDEAVVAREPFQYRMKVVDNHLVMLIDNRTDDAFQLLGEQSSVVDPNGQSHPLRPMAIAPHSYGKLIFPPVEPRYYYPSGPVFGVGVGTVVTHHHHDHRRYLLDERLFDEDEQDEPAYLMVVDDNAVYWDWRGEGEIRLTIQYQRANDKPFTHDWVIGRRKAK
jgi:hypothetical protein